MARDSKEREILVVTIAGRRSETLSPRAVRKRVLPSEALRRLKADLGKSSGIDPVVAYAADLRAVIEEFERLTEADYDRP
jgi:hypothetical protein